MEVHSGRQNLRTPLQRHDLLPCHLLHSLHHRHTRTMSPVAQDVGFDRYGAGELHQYHDIYIQYVISLHTPRHLSYTISNQIPQQPQQQTS
jgi:hypothetical protein